MAGIDLTKSKSKSTKTKSPDYNQRLQDILKKDITYFGNKLNDKKKEEFYLELGMLLDAGVDIKTALDLIADEQTKNKDKEFFKNIREFVIAGGTVSAAMKQTGKFSAYEYFSVQIGEETGKLSLILKELSDFFHKKIKQRRQFTSALAYPILVMCTSLGMVIFMMTAIVPMFSGMFERFGADLPAVTKMVIAISNVFTDYFYLLILFIVSMVVVVVTQRKQIWFRDFTSRLILRTPIIGEMVRKIYIARLCHFMTLLTASKIPLLRTIDLIKQMIGYYPIEVSLTKVEKDILNGVPLHKSLQEFPIYYSKMVTLIKIGEEVNQMEFFFDKIAKQYADDVEHQSTIIKSLIEPIMILFLAVVVGTIVIAMYLPLFQLSTAF
jgi:type IV pilus assembly protein PilC